MPVSEDAVSPGEQECLLPARSFRVTPGPQSFPRQLARGLAPVIAVAISLTVVVTLFNRTKTGPKAAATVSWAFDNMGLNAEVGDHASHATDKCVMPEETSETIETCKATVEYVYWNAIEFYSECVHSDPNAAEPHESNKSHESHQQRRLSGASVANGTFDLSKEEEVKACLQCAMWHRRHEDGGHGCQQPCHPTDGYPRCVSSGGHNNHHDVGYLTILFLLAMVGIGCLIQLVQDRCLPQIPYTCLLFIAGLILAVIHQYRTRPSDKSEYSHWYTSVEMWEHVNPHLFFYIFLPLLVFAEAMRLNINLAVRILPQVLLMAVPGVVLGAALTGAFAYFFLGYDWTVSVSLLFGSILAATDPVAVVSLFNTLGVSPRLTMLISGESLLNDGTAIVAFGLMMLSSTGKELTPLLCTVYFFKMTLVSVILGVALAWIAILMIGWCAESNYHTDAMIQVCVTIILSMLCFFIAEAEVQQFGPPIDGERIGTSGVLTVVSAGFVVSHFAWPRFVSRETVHVVWEAVEFIGNTVVFFLAGLLWGGKVLETSRETHLSVFDLLRLFELYVVLHVIRAFVVLVLWPFFNLTGQRVTSKEALVMTWSGLRGAVGLILAIIVDDTPEMRRIVGTQFLFHIGGIAMMTISINATLAPILLRNLGLTSPEEIEQRTTEVFEARLQKKARTTFEEEKLKEQWAGVTPAAVEKLLPHVWDAHEGNPHQRPALVSNAQGKEPEYAEKQGLRFYREAFLRNVRSMIWEDIEDGILPKTGRAARILVFACEYGLLKANERLADWEMVKYKSHEMELCPCINRCLGSTWPFRNWDWVQSVFPSQTTQNVWKAYLALCFISAHKSAQKQVPEYLSSVIRPEILEKVKAESEDEVKQAQEFLDNLEEEAIRHVHVRMVAGQILHLQTQEVNRYVEHGVLDDKASSQLLHELQHQKRLLADANYIINDDDVRSDYSSRSES